MWTTFSFSSTPLSSRMTRRGPAPPPCAMTTFPFPLELETALTRPVGERAHATVVEEAVAIEDDAGDALLLAAPGHQQPDFLRGADVARLLELRLELGRERRHGEQRLVRRVGDDLRVDVL